MLRIEIASRTGFMLHSSQPWPGSSPPFCRDPLSSRYAHTQLYTLYTIILSYYHPAMRTPNCILYILCSSRYTYPHLALHALHCNCILCPLQTLHTTNFIYIYTIILHTFIPLWYQIHCREPTSMLLHTKATISLYPVQVPSWTLSSCSLNKVWQRIHYAQCTPCILHFAQFIHNN